jgi:prophage tail gpP-like protein
MADSDSLGAVDDAVRVTLGGSEALIVESYEIHQAVLTQPAAFNLRMGYGDVVQTLAAQWPPHTPFTLSIGQVLQQTGFTDGYELAGNDNATEITVRGRDNLAQLHDAYVTADISYSNLSFADLVAKVLDDSGYELRTLRYTNAANRSVMAGVGVKETAAPRDASTEQATGPIQKALQAKVGERRYEFLTRVLATAGFFLWCASDGTFILSEPNANQTPTYQIVRQRNATRNLVSVSHASLRVDTTHRFSEAIIYARGGGRKFARQRSKGSFTDDEVIGWGITARPFVARDANVTNQDQADFYARRKLAESRRAGWQLEYTVTGHTTAALAGGRAVWTPDTVVTVDDDEFGIHENLWIEGVTFRRDESGGTSTQLTLMRPSDLIFAESEAPS